MLFNSHKSSMRYYYEYTYYYFYLIRVSDSSRSNMRRAETGHGARQLGLQSMMLITRLFLLSHWLLRLRHWTPRSLDQV